MWPGTGAPEGRKPVNSAMSREGYLSSMSKTKARSANNSPGKRSTLQMGLCTRSCTHSQVSHNRGAGVSYPSKALLYEGQKRLDLAEEGKLSADKARPLVKGDPLLMPSRGKKQASVPHHPTSVCKPDRGQPCPFTRSIWSRDGIGWPVAVLPFVRPGAVVLLRCLLAGAQLHEPPASYARPIPTVQTSPCSRRAPVQESLGVLVVLQARRRRRMGARDLLRERAPIFPRSRQDPDAAYGHAPAHHPRPLLQRSRCPFAQRVLAWALHRSQIRPRVVRLGAASLGPALHCLDSSGARSRGRGDLLFQEPQEALLPPPA